MKDESSESWKIDDVRRSHVVYREGARVTWVLGEALAGGYSGADYVIYASNALKWKPPHDGEPLLDEKKKEIIDRVLVALKTRGLKVEIE